MVLPRYPPKMTSLRKLASQGTVAESGRIEGAVGCEKEKHQDFITPCHGPEGEPTRRLPGTISFPSPGFPVNFLAFLTLHASNLWSLKPKPTVARTDLFCSVEMSDPALSKKTWFWNPDHSFHTANNRGFHGDKRNLSGETRLGARLFQEEA